MSKMKDLFGDQPYQHKKDPVAAKTAKEAGLAQVLRKSSADWRSRVVEHVRGLPAGEYTGEDIRLGAEDIAGKPHSPHAWGAMINSLVKDGLLIDTGRSKKMATKTSHARRTPIWRRG